MENINYSILATEEDFIVVYKPSGLPSAPMSLDDKENVFSYAAKEFPELLNVEGRKQIEHGLIHRLDTITQGLVIIARTQKGYNNLLELQKENKIIKSYTAICHEVPENAEVLQGFPPNLYNNFNTFDNSVTVSSFFRAYGDGRKQVRPVIESSGAAALKKLEKKVLYSTDIRIIENKSENIKIECSITNGYRHQIRCHLAWIGLPIKEDPLYDSKYSQKQMYFCANKINVNGNIFEVR